MSLFRPEQSNLGGTGISNAEDCIDRARPTAEGTPNSLRVYPFIEWLRGGLALVIVIHHLVRYSPQADAASALIPRLIEVFDRYGSLAVQVFLVIGGFVGAITLERKVPSWNGFGNFLLKRYLRLGLPYYATIIYGLALYSFIPPAFAAFDLFERITWQGLLVHTLFLQDIFGHPNLFAGFWYLSIDFQCNALTYLLLLFYSGILTITGIQKPDAKQRVFLVIFLPIGISSLFIWNLDSRYDPYALYYFGTVFLGLSAGWSLTGRVPSWVFWGYIGVAGLALTYHWRLRLMVAVISAIAIYLTSRLGLSQQQNSLANWLSRISFSLFLTHYPTIWAVTSVGAALTGTGAWNSIAWMIASILASIVVGGLMYELVESRILRLTAQIEKR